MATYLPTRFPLFWEEIRRRMRGGRAQIVLLVYTLLLIGLLFCVTQMQDVGSDPREWPRFGKILWNVFLVAQLGIIMILSPGMTAGALASEKEQGTLDLLLLTRMGSLSIVLGKFFGAIVQMLFLLLAGLPIISVVFFFGGVSPTEIAMGYLLTIVTGIGYASLGFFTSCKCKRVVPAVAWGYTLMLLLAIGPVVALLIMQMSNLIQYLDRTLMLLIWATDPLASYAIVEFGNIGSSSVKESITLWPTILTMLGLTVLALVECTLLIRRLRGLSVRFIPRTLKKAKRVAESP